MRIKRVLMSWIEDEKTQFEAININQENVDKIELITRNKIN